MRESPLAMMIRRQCEELRVRGLFVAMGRDEVRRLWDEYDGLNTPGGIAGEDIHAYLNLIGDGAYCAV